MGIQAILTAASIGASVLGGIQQQRAAESQAEATEREAARQATLARQTSERQAREEARQNIELEKRQKLSFLKSGVALTGTPLTILAETRERGGENVEAILETGRTQQEGLLGQGELQASELRSGGRQALFRGLGSGIATGATAFGQGVFTPAPKFDPRRQAPPRKPTRLT